MGLFTRVRGKVEVFSVIHGGEPLTVPGIVTGAAYAAGDAFGTKFGLRAPKEGVIATANFLDHDNEGLPKELWLLRADFTGTADNAAFALTDGDLSKVVGVIVFDTFRAANANRVGGATPALYYKAPSGLLYCQFVTRGADNIAAEKLPEFYLVVT